MFDIPAFECSLAVGAGPSAGGGWTHECGYGQRDD